jgi:glycerol uptake facilitator-like aquaporin
MHKFKQKIHPYKDIIAEFLGTMVLIIFGVGVVASVVLGGGGDTNTIYWCWGWGEKNACLNHESKACF